MLSKQFSNGEYTILKLLKEIKYNMETSISSSLRERGERKTYRQRTGGRRRDKQDVTHLRQVHSCSRLQRSQHEGKRNKKGVKDSCIQSYGQANVGTQS